MSAAKRLIVNADDLGRSRGGQPRRARGAPPGHRDQRQPVRELPGRGGGPDPGAGHPGPRRRPPPDLHGRRRPSCPRAHPDAWWTSRAACRPRPTAWPRAGPDELLAEARAQLRRFRELMGRDPTHLDTRQHAHRAVRGARSACSTLAWETGLPVRNASRDVHERLRREGIRSTDQVTSRSSTARPPRSRRCVTLLGGLPLGTTELMCRPVAGRGARPSERLRRCRATRALDALTHREARQILQAAGVRLIHFGDL